MAEIAGTVLGGLTGEVYKDVKRSAVWIRHKYHYMKDPQIYYERMTMEASALYVMKKDVAAEADGDCTKQLSNVSSDWIRRVDETEKEVERLKEKHRRMPAVWSFSCSRHSKRMEKMREKLNALREEGRINFGTSIAVRRPPERVRPIPAPKTEEMPSLHNHVTEIIDYLKDRDVRRIGVWGFPGMGKTTVMQNVNNDKEIAKMFDIVIWVTVPKDPTIEYLQNVVAQRLNLKLEGVRGTTETAYQISKQLKEKRYLLLLDEFQKYFDMKGSLDLAELGIIWDKQKDSRVVLATRERGNYVNMEINELVNVTPLSGDDALKMFRKRVGQKIDGPGIKQIAEQVVRECGCIPLVIEKVAGTFSQKRDKYHWREGLNGLKIWGRKTKGMEELLDILSVCYESLEGDGKVCFLYSALYPEDFEIFKDYLLECWRAEQLIKGDQAHTILDDLIKLSLLEECKKMKHLRMNKVLRDMALNILLQTDDSKFLVRDAHKKSEEPPDEEEWVQANRISLMDDKLRRLPEAPCCNNLFTLLLQKNSALTVIPKLFFRYMQSLQVLDLQEIGITSLPACLSRLTSLRALYLNSCKHLKVLPSSVQALKVLEVLDIRGTRIKKLPRKMVNLIRLRCLRMSSSNFGGGYPNNHKVISSLSFLEELSIDVDSYQQWWDTVGEAVTQEVVTLTKLTSLSFCFPKLDCLEIFITRNRSWKSNCLEKGNCFKFQFCVGYQGSSWEANLEDFEYGIDKCLKVVKVVGVHVAISKVLKESYVFELIDHKGVSKLSDFGIEYMTEMRVCLIDGCDEIKTIIGVDTITTGVMKCLEKMYVNNVSNLERIWEGPLHVESLVQLTTLELCQCPKLKILFSEGMIQQLSKLQHLCIKECHDIEELIMESENGRLDSNALPSLKTLVLEDLPKLTSIWVDDTLDWPSLRMIKIVMCNSLIRLPFNDKNAINLGSIECQESWWNNLQQEIAIKKRVLEQNVLLLHL